MVFIRRRNCSPPPHPPLTPPSPPDKRRPSRHSPFASPLSHPLLVLPLLLPALSRRWSTNDKDGVLDEAVSGRPTGSAATRCSLPSAAAAPAAGAAAGQPRSARHKTGRKSQAEARGRPAPAAWAQAAQRRRRRGGHCPRGACQRPLQGGGVGAGRAAPSPAPPLPAQIIKFMIFCFFYKCLVRTFSSSSQNNPEP